MTHWTGLPEGVFYQGLSGGLNGQEAAESHCGVTLPDRLSGDGMVRAMMKRSLVPPGKLVQALEDLRGEERVAKEKCDESFAFAFKKGKRKHFSVPANGLDQKDLKWLVARAVSSQVFTDSGPALDLQRRNSWEITNESLHCKTRVPDTVLEKMRQRVFRNAGSLRPRFEKIVIYTEGGFRPGCFEGEPPCGDHGRVV